MKLSEAIRLGAMALPEVHGPVFRRTADGICGACALGAALYAVGATTSEDVGKALAYDGGQWLPLLCQVVPHPTKPRTIVMTSALIDLFEYQCWTREQIADWVETIEAQQALVPIPEDAQQKAIA